MAAGTTIAKKPENSFLAHLTTKADIWFAAAVIAVLSILILPLPAFMIDLMLTISITIALLILMVCTYTEEPLQFSVFPGLLLVVTLFRLALNISTTRLILSEGTGGRIIEAFGTFVIKGNYVIGLVIFALLNIINFVVITKGSNRIAEVAARFTLDAMPGKQMAIDADLNNGLIGEEEAKERRDKITREADFYGAMDGASKFVRGDAVAGLIITFINIVGGIVIGVVQRGMPIEKAASLYTTLTVGDGLVAQIPALIISIGAGILVSRAASKENLGSGIVKQLFGYKRSLWLATVVLVLFGIVPGFPLIPMWLLAGGLAWIASKYNTAEKNDAAAVLTATKETAKPKEKPEEFLAIDPLELEIGYSLIPLVDTAQDGDLLSRITLIRKQQAIQMGIIIPPIRIRDNIQLKSNEYSVKIRGNEVARSELRLGHYLALNPGTAIGELEGSKTHEPTYGLPATWIAERERERAESNGFTVVEPPAVLSTHLVEIIKRNAHRILTRQDVQTLVNVLKQDSSAVVEELIPNMMSIGGVHKILQRLLKEGIPVRDLATICEALSDYAPLTKDPDLLTEYVRYALSPTITQKFVDNDGKLYALTMTPQVEDVLAEEVQSAGGRMQQINLNPQFLQTLYRSIQSNINIVKQQGRQPIIIVAPSVRLYVRRLLEPVLPEVTVLSFGELVADVSVESLGKISV